MWCLTRCCLTLRTLCACTSPVFVRPSAQLPHMCELCGGPQSSGLDGSHLAAFPVPSRVTVSKGLQFSLAVRFLAAALPQYLVALGISFATMAYRLPFAVERNRRAAALYAEWCAATHSTKPSHTDSDTAGEGRNGSESGNGVGMRPVRSTVPLHLLELAAYAWPFAAASYGLPYECGDLSSVSRALRLCVPPNSRLALASTAEQCASLRRVLRGGRRDPFLEVATARYASAAGQPCAAVVLDHRARRIVVAFRGSLSLADIVADLTVDCEEVLLDGHKRALIPRGFYDNVRAAAKWLTPALRSIAAQHDDYALLCVGHSLGAIEALLFHLLFRPSEVREVRSVAFAPAPCVDVDGAAAALSGLAPDALLSWVYGIDAVPRLQLRAVGELFGAGGAVRRLVIPGMMLHVPEGGDVAVEVPSDETWRKRLVLRREALEHHLPREYGAAVRRVLQRRITQESSTPEISPLSM